MMEMYLDQSPMDTSSVILTRNLVLVNLVSNLHRVRHKLVLFEVECSGSVGPVVAHLTADREVHGSNPTWPKVKISGHKK